MVLMGLTETAVDAEGHIAKAPVAAFVVEAGRPHPVGVTVDAKVTAWPAKAGAGETAREVLVGRPVTVWVRVAELPAKELVGR